MAKTFWLSFCDNDKPNGEQFLGACVVDVSEEQANDALTDIDVRFPNHADGAEWIGAAIKAAWELGCNPGGEMASFEMTDAPAKWHEAYKRGVLMSKSEIETIDAALEAK